MSFRSRASRLGSVLACVALPSLSVALPHGAFSALVTAPIARTAQREAGEGTSKAPTALEPVPSERQLGWHELELYGGLRFGPATFGRADAAFEPTDLDCRQWAEVARDAGLRGLILDVRPDGFALWSSETTERGVRTSAWRDGRGDVLRELADACREHDLALGIEIPADERLAEQLEELARGYGELFEIRLQPTSATFERAAVSTLVRELQPVAVLAGGPDVRWLGADGRRATKTCWAMLAGEGFWPTDLTDAERVSGDRDGNAWVAPEATATLRRDRDGEPRSVHELEELWRETVGRNASLLLYLEPNRDGRIPDADAASARAFGTWLERTFATDFARGARALSDAVRGDDRFHPRRIVDGDPTTYWATADDVRDAHVEVDLGVPATFNRIRLSEPIELGQRVTSFSIDAFENGDWRRVAEGTTIGRKRVLAIPAVSSRRISLNVAARGPIAIATLGLHLAPPRVLVEPAGRAFVDTQTVKLASDVPGARVHYTLDGSEPTESSPLYTEPLELSRSVTLRARAFFEGSASVVPVTETFRAWSADDLLHPLHLLRAPEPGLRWRSHEGDWPSVAAVDWSEPVAEGVTRTIDVDLRTRAEDVALVFEGYVQAPSDGVYRFHARGDEPFRVVIGDRDPFAADGEPHVWRAVDVGLRQGWHPLRVEVGNRDGDMSFDLEWSGPDFERGELGAALGH